MNRESPLGVVFYKTDTNSEPVREWLKSLPEEYRKTIGKDIKTLQYGWPLGMPLAKKLCDNIWEVRSKIRNIISRILFTLSDNKVVLLHGFIKKTRKTPEDDLDLAIKRMKQYKRR
ncbi:MAG: type II toxin-antitoxin system RelE/ParE family toxin [Candidatus Omnitrophota bacterium]